MVEDGRSKLPDSVQEALKGIEVRQHLPEGSLTSRKNACTFAPTREDIKRHDKKVRDFYAKKRGETGGPSKHC
jgi:hypothetical protein